MLGGEIWGRQRHTGIGKVVVLDFNGVGVLEVLVLDLGKGNHLARCLCGSFEEMAMGLLGQQGIGIAQAC